MTSKKTRKKAREALTGKWGKGASIILVYTIFTSILNAFSVKLEENSTIALIISIAILIINIPISYGLIISFIKLKRGKEIGSFDFFKDGFNNFGRAWGLVGNIFLKMIVPVIIIFIAALVMVFSLGTSVINSIADNSLQSLPNIGIVGVIGIVVYMVAVIYALFRAMLYSLSNFIAYDNPEKSTKESVEESAKFMKGNRWKLIRLELSFIVYPILPLFTLLLLPEFLSHDLSSGIGFAILAVFAVSISLLFIIPYMQVAIICFYEQLTGKDDSLAEVISSDN